MEQALAPHSSPAAPEEGLAEQNVQARVRGNLLMALSNKFGHLILTTGNKSEVAVGYCTLYGDMAGGLAVISDVPKMMVYELARFINAQSQRQGKPAPIPENTITKPPSAELRPNQKDQDSLPPYDILDAIIEGYVEQEKSVAEIIREGFDPRNRSPTRHPPHRHLRVQAQADGPRHQGHQPRLRLRPPHAPSPKATTPNGAPCAAINNAEKR